MYKSRRMTDGARLLKWWKVCGKLRHTGNRGNPVMPCVGFAAHLPSLGETARAAAPVPSAYHDVPSPSAQPKDGKAAMMPANTASDARVWIVSTCKISGRSAVATASSDMNSGTMKGGGRIIRVNNAT